MKSLLLPTLIISLLFALPAAAAPICDGDCEEYDDATEAAAADRSTETAVREAWEGRTVIHHREIRRGWQEKAVGGLIDKLREKSEASKGDHEVVDPPREGDEQADGSTE